MAGKIRHLVNRSGRYHARVVVPKDLRGIIGKTELRIALGGDYREALKLLPGAVTQIQHQIAVAEQKANPNQPQNASARFPLAPDQIAHSHYHQRMAFDDQLRNDPRYSAVGIDDLLVGRLRAALAGNANDVELGELVGAQIERFRATGNVDATPGSTEWREIARALCQAELEALARSAERDEGDFTGNTHCANHCGRTAPGKRPYSGQYQTALERLRGAPPASRVYAVWHWSPAASH